MASAVLRCELPVGDHTAELEIRLAAGVCCDLGVYACDAVLRTDDGVRLLRALDWCAGTLKLSRGEFEPGRARRALDLTPAAADFTFERAIFAAVAEAEAEL